MNPANIGLRLTCAVLALVAASWVTLGAQDVLTPSPGDGTLIVGSFPNVFSIIDEATATIVGQIPYKSGMPRRTTLSRDKKRFYTIEADMDIVEILDLASRSTIGTFTLSEGAVLHDGPNQVAGERVIVYLKEERSVVESGSSANW